MKKDIVAGLGEIGLPILKILSSARCRNSDYASLAHRLRAYANLALSLRSFPPAMFIGRALKTLRRPFAPLTRPSARHPF